MSKIVITLCAVFAIFTTACAQNNSKSDNMKKKTLVTYFSATGTTENAAKKIASVTGADIMSIQPVPRLDKQAITQLCGNEQPEFTSGD